MTVHDVTVSQNATAFLLSSYGSQREYPDNRMLYELDGTTVRYFRGANSGNGEVGVTAWVEYALTDTDRRNLNGWTYRTAHDNPYESYKYYFTFPEPRNLTYGLFGRNKDGSIGGNPDWRFYWSSDTTNGVDGNWTQLGVTSTLVNTTYTAKRRDAWLNHLNLTNVTGIRCHIDHTLSLYAGDGGNLHLIHLFGDAAQDSHRLEFWHPTENRKVEGYHFDWGDIKYGDSTKQFRIKNCSPTKRALDITLSIDSTNDSWNPTIASYHTINDGTGYSSTKTITSLTAGEISSVYTLRRNIPTYEPLNWFSARIKAVATTWYEFIHNVTSDLVSSAEASSIITRERNADATLSVGHHLSDAALYRSSRPYRSKINYIGSGLTQSHAGAATLTASVASSETFMDEYLDSYSVPFGLAASPYIPNKKTTSALSVGAYGDMHSDVYLDTYGNSGLYADARLTEIHNAQASLEAAVTLVGTAGPTVAGGTITDSGGYRYHTFTESGTLTVNTPITIDTLIVAAGGSGGTGGANVGGGGGGAGGYLSYTSESLSPGNYTVTVGVGGASANGGDSSFNSHTAIGGGLGGGLNVSGVGASGGSGGGSAGTNVAVGTGTSGQGYNGGLGSGTYGTTTVGGGGGGGASAVGSANTNRDVSAAGGAGATWLNGVTYAAGGSGGIRYGTSVGASGAANTGNGADGSGGQSGGGANSGGSGIVIVRYVFP